MGCVSSKLFIKDHKFSSKNGDLSSHVVSLTSSTYGVLKLDEESQKNPPQCIKECVIEVKKPSPATAPPHSQAEVINAWELMEDLDETEVPCSKKSPKSSKSPKARVVSDHRSPLKFLNQFGSPRKQRKSGGKENNKPGRAEFSPKMYPKSCNLQESPWKLSPRFRNLKQGSPKEMKSESSKDDSSVFSRKSLSPLFDNPKPIQKLSSEEEEQIKKMVSSSPIPHRKTTNSKVAEAILQQFDEKCPPGGENSIVIYTTTLRGIRKTFEDCNSARSILESHRVRTFERDVSMHSGFKEELRGLMGTKEVKVPLVFVKGRLVGGAEEIVKLEEEGRLGILLSGIPEAAATGCGSCAGVRFIMCLVCHGSRKVLGEDGKNSVKCGECNENGLVQCPICS